MAPFAEYNEGYVGSPFGMDGVGGDDENGDAAKGLGRSAKSQAVEAGLGSEGVSQAIKNEFGVRTQRRKGRAKRQTLRGDW